MKGLLSAILIVVLPITVMANDKNRQDCLGKKVEDFRLRDYRGAEIALSDQASKKLVVVAFLGADCPVARLYAPRLMELAKEYEPKGVAFLPINANVQDSITDVTEYARTLKFTLPILKDPGNAVADRLGANRTPEVFVLDADRVVRYHGRIDDQYGVGFMRPKANRRDLAIALDELLAAKAVTVATTELSGCIIGRVHKTVKEGALNYSKHIAPILQNRCLSCHRPGEIGPFSMTNYEEVVGWADTMGEAIREQRMPPWHLDSRYGKWANDASLPENEKKMILDWIEAGAPEGDPKDLPPARTFTDGWQIPKPDVVLKLPRPVKIPASGVVQYQYLVVETGFTEDKWIQAVEVRPSCRPVVHHALVFVQPPGGAPANFRGFASNWLAATVPNGKPMIWAPGRAKRIPAGSRLLFQMHYTTTGTPQEDQTSIGLVFADPKTVKQEVSTEMVAQPKLVLPPRTDHCVVEATVALQKESTILTLMPHTHLRGKMFKYVAEYPDGKTEVLMDVPRYDFNWQNTYIMAEPKTLPAGTRLHCTAVYDNSEKNKSNPDPNATVRWGEQTYEEMMIGYFDVVQTEQDLVKSPPTPSQQKKLPALEPQIAALASKALQSHAAFEELATALQASVPGLDRLCVTAVDGDRLRVERAKYLYDEPNKVAEAGFENSMRLFALSGYSMFGRKIYVPDLKQARGMDMTLMGKVMACSLHLPLSLDGKPASLNCWSRKAGTFSQEKQDYLEAVVEAMKKKP